MDGCRISELNIDIYYSNIIHIVEYTHFSHFQMLLRRGLSQLFRFPCTYRKFHGCSNTMAKSKFEYVRQFELPDSCLPNCWIVVRVDGKGFHK